MSRQKHDLGYRKRLIAAQTGPDSLTRAQRRRKRLRERVASYAPHRAPEELIMSLREAEREMA